MASVTKRAADTGKVPPPRLLYTETELREVRKMQAIAHVERTEERQ
jgi:pyruvate ferredoxin oxidoreductase alpha subunit